jgi:hypothetical protein
MHTQSLTRTVPAYSARSRVCAVHGDVMLFAAPAYLGPAMRRAEQNRTGTGVVGR